MEHTPVAVKAKGPNCLESFGILLKLILANGLLI